MSIDVNVQNDLVIVTESSEDITVNVSNAAGAPGPAGANGVGVPVGGATGQVLKKFTNTDYDTYWAADASGLTSVGISMPSAFTVSNTPLTTNGTIAVSGAGTASQYVRGDGQLANFPTSGGGGSSVNYYLNGSVNQGTFGGDTYYEMSKTPIIGAGTNFTRTNAQGNGYIASFITDAADPALLNIPGGNWNVEFYFAASSGGGTPSFYAELYKVSSSNVFTLIASGSTNPEGITQGTVIDQYFTSIPVPQTSLLSTDRLAIRIFVTPSGRTITLHTEDNNLCEVLTTFSTGLNALNGLTSQVQYFATGTSGTDFAISSATDTHTFNLPTASATNRGALSSADWSTFNSKTSGSGVTGQVAYWNGTNSQTGSNTLTYTPTTSLLVNNSVTAATAIARGTNLTPTLIASASSDVLVGLDLNPTYTSGAFAAVRNFGLRISGNVNAALSNSVFNPSTGNRSQVGYSIGNSDAENFYGGFFWFAPTFSGVNIEQPASFMVDSSGSNGLNLLAHHASGTIKFITGAYNLNNERARFHATGNFSLGSTSDGGQRLQVYGDAYIKGSGATSATNALLVQNSAGTQLIRVQNNGWLSFGPSANGPFISTQGASSASLLFYNIGNVNSDGAFIFRGDNAGTTSGNNICLNISQIISPSSGTGNFSLFSVTSTINQTGGANGITRGLYVNPALTAAADWRSIEWSNNSGWGLYGAGTARNFLGGDLLFGNNKGFVLSQSGTNKSISVLASEIVDNFAGLSIYPSQGTNVGNAINIIPRGTGYNAGIKSQIVVFNTDFVADNVNYEFSQFRAAGTAFTLTTGKAGTGTIRPFLLSSGYSDGITNPNQLWLYASGRVGVNTTSESTFTFDVNGTARVSGKLSLTAGTTAASQINLASSTAPTSPVNGDIWFDGTDLKMRIGGVTKTFTLI